MLSMSEAEQRAIGTTVHKQLMNELPAPRPAPLVAILARRKKIRGEAFFRDRTHTTHPAIKFSIVDEFAQSRPLMWRDIVRQVAFRHNVTIPQIMGKTRKTDVVIARHEMFYRMHEETRMSFVLIGRKCGGFDHTTVISGVRRHKERMACPE